MTPEVFRYVERELYNYHDTRRELEEQRLDIIEEGTSTGLVVMDDRVRPPSDPTHDRAVRLLTNRRLRRMDDTVRAIARVLYRLDAHKRQLVDLRYFDGRLPHNGIAEVLCVSRRTYYRWRDEVVWAVAIELGLENGVNQK